jgi:hypothetical protein
MNQAFGTSTAAEAEQMKRIYLETDPILLAITVAVSILHSIFDVLAFKNGKLIR